MLAGRFLLILSLVVIACTEEVQRGAPPEACPAQDGPGTLHAADVTADETWAAADGPHVIDGTLTVRDGATLVIEACAEVRLKPNAGLDVGTPDLGGAEGHLVVDGAEGAPVRFVRDGADPWASLGIFAPATAELRHVTLEGGGADGFREHATLLVVGDGLAPSTPTLSLDTLTVEGSVGVGVVLAGAATLSADSVGLTVTGSGAAPLVAGLHSLLHLPDGDLTGNADDTLVVHEDLANTYVGLQVDTTLARLSVPYRWDGTPGEPLRVGGSDGSHRTTLTLEAGVELRFAPGTGLRTTSFLEPFGAVVANGTADAPVRFTSAADAPQPGDWTGLWFEGPVSGDNQLVHADIAYAGGYCSCSLRSCSPVSYWEAAVIFEDAPASAFLFDSRIRQSAGHGVLRSWTDREDIDFLASNTFEDVAGCDQTWPELGDEVCPDTAYACE